MKLLNSLIIICVIFLFSSNSIFADQVLFSDDFNDNDVSDWEVINTSCISAWSTNLGRYGIKILGEGCNTNVKPSNFSLGSYLDSYKFDVDIFFASDVNVDRAFLFLIKDSINWYDFHIFGRSLNLEKVINGQDVSLGYFDYDFQANVTYHFSIVIKDHTFFLSINGTEFPPVIDPSPYLTSGSIGLRAGSGAVNHSEVWFDNVVVTGLDGATPIPTPTTTPVPSVVPTPSTTPQPIRKVVFVPGLGASWNADALLNCKTENYSGDWTLAPYAEGFYNTVISALGEYGKPFYYDWRKDVRSQKDKLQNFINNLGEEKVNLVGHSLGGLVGRAYLEQTGDLSKLDKLMTAGSPHRGSPIAYPAWAAGDLWHDDLLTKIGITLLMKRCTGLSDNDREAVRKVAPSLNNLLPNFDYLRDKKTGILKPVEGMLPEFQNDWLSKSIFPPPSTNVSIRTLSGTGFRTIENLPVNDPSKQDIKNGNWLDGKPAGKEWTNEGDGTALLKSTQIDGLGSENRVINQTHGGLMTSEEGINEIFNFFGLNRNNLTFNKAPSSALIVIGYPANFWVKDKNGKVIKDKEGMIALMNPETQKYQFGLLPKKDKTLFIVAQFLEDGRTYWKEYEFKNVLLKFGNINYNQSDPNEDLLR